MNDLPTLHRLVPLSTAVLLLLATTGCGDPAPHDTTHRAASIVRLEMVRDSVSVTLDQYDRIRLTATLETGCAQVSDDRVDCSLEDETRWVIRDSSVARRHVFTRSRYDGRDTAWAVYLLKRPGRAWVVVTNRTGEVADSSLLLVESGP